MKHKYLESTQFRNKSFDMLFTKIIFHHICKIKQLKFAVLLFLQAGFLNALIAQSTNQNYIVSTVPTSAISNPSTLTDANSVSTIKYFDGLGRPVETIQKAVSGITSNDLVSFTEYDGTGREYKHWLPTLSVGNNGAFIGLTDFTSKAGTQYGSTETPYSTIEYEPSSLNRVTGQLGAGAVWNNTVSPKKVKTEYGANALNEVSYYYVNAGNKLQRSGAYAANSLYKTVVTDEDSKTTTEYKDKQGRVVMKRNSANVDTYYIYNDLGQLCFVIPPIAADGLTTDGEITDLTTDILKKYCYLYQYDERGNCIYKRLPGCTPVFMVYDKADRLVLSQDGNQRKKTQGNAMQWTATKYDVLGRVILTGTMYRSETDSTANYLTIRTLFKNELVVDAYSVNGFSTTTALTINYYDNYNFIGNQSALNYITLSGYDSQWASAKGLLTGTRTYLLDGSGNYNTSAIYYDYRGLVVQTRATNYLGGNDIVCNAYNFSGKPTQTLKTHSIAPPSGGTGGSTELYTFTYDNALRPLVTNYYLNGATTPVTLTNNTNGYDELGRLISHKRHNGTDTEAYTYNIRNWTTSINSGTYLEELYYNTLPTGATGTPCYNGNISYQISGVNVAALKPFYNYAYTYSYDNLNRLNTAYCYRFNTSQGAAAGHREEYNYDKLGNVNYLMRGNSSTTVDYLSFSYNGNQITSIFDYNGSQNLYTTKEYQDKNHVYGATNEMAYDPNGNLIKDLDRDIVTIKYNVLNLPDVIQFRTGDKIVNIYDAGGQKLRSDYYTYSLKTTIPLSLSAGDINSLTYSPINYTYTGTVYVDNKEYGITKGSTPVNGVYPDVFSFVRLRTSEGYISTLSNPQYYYYRKDHLGNNREVWCATTNTTVQKTQYYPSGLPWAESSGTSVQPYKYNGKEWVEMNGYDCTDLGARVDYNSILRTPTMDHHAENDYSISPYSVCKNNPVNIIDPDGQDCIVTIQWDDNGEITGVSISATVNITGKTNAEQAKELNKEAKETFKSKNMDGINVSFKINYKYVDKAPDKLKAGENVLTFSKESSSDEGGQIDNAHMNTSTNERHDGNRGTIYANGNTRTVMHETGHLLGLPDRYDKWEWLGEKHIDNHKGFEKDLMSVGNNKLLDQLYYNQYVTKAKRFDPNTKLIKSYIEIGYDRNGWLVTPYEKGGKHGSNQ